MARIKEIDEKSLCEDYLTNSIGTEGLALKYKIGKKRVREILNANGIERKKRGGQVEKIEYKVSDWSIKKYPPIEGKHYVAVDKNSGFSTVDVDNYSGILTTHIEKEYGVKIPTLYDRRKYYMINGDYWWEQWFYVKIVDNKPIKKCPYCDWTTVDIENKSGMFETHLRKIHNKSKFDYLKEFPEDRKYFETVNPQKQLQLELDNRKFVICKVCGQKLAHISKLHLAKHGMTKKMYIDAYGIKDLVCEDFHEQMSLVAQKVNENMTFNKNSAAENFIKDWIISHGIDCYSDRKILHGKEIDIYIPSKKIGIEYDGVRWHTEGYGKGKNYHADKMKECLKNGIGLITIFEDEFELHKEIVMSKLSHILGFDSDKRKIYARKCEINMISKNDAEIFLEKNHVQGFANATIYLGAFYKNELIGVMTFVSRSDEEYELNRFATDINSICCGVGGKLFKHFVKNYNFKTIKSFADRRWTINYENNIYSKLGFEIECFTYPEYTYINKNVDKYKRFHKFGFRKQILLKKYPDLLNENMTEKEMTQKLGYDRIWDCGLIKYVYKKKEK